MANHQEQQTKFLVLDHMSKKSKTDPIVKNKILHHMQILKHFPMLHDIVKMRLQKIISLPRKNTIILITDDNSLGNNENK